MSKIILDLCGGTLAWSKPYKDAGYDVRAVTLPDNDVLTYQPPENVYGILAAPPCTMFSRARTTAKTPRDYQSAMRVVAACLNIIWRVQYNDQIRLKFWAIENPAGHLQRFLGRPTFKFQPYDFGDHYSKETWLWGRFTDPINNPIKLTPTEILQSRNNTRPLPKIPGLSVAARRAITPPGFAQAFFNANP